MPGKTPTGIVQKDDDLSRKKGGSAFGAEIFAKARVGIAATDKYEVLEKEGPLQYLIQLTFSVLFCEVSVKFSVVKGLPHCVEDSVHLLPLYAARLGRIKHGEGSSQHCGHTETRVYYQLSASSKENCGQ